jgi:hypothetical protein
MGIFTSSAGYLSPKLPRSAGDTSAMILTAPAIRSVGLGQDQMLRRLAATVCTSAMHTIDFDSDEAFQ